MFCFLSDWYTQWWSLLSHINIDLKIDDSGLSVISFLLWRVWDKGTAFLWQIYNQSVFDGVIHVQTIQSGISVQNSKKSRGLSQTVD